MATTTIEFLPERLNRPPVVFRGLTSAEIFLAFAAGSTFGLLLGILLAIAVSLWAVAPTSMLICGFGTVFFSGKLLAAKKRGRATMWLYRALQVQLTLSPFKSLFELFGLANRNLILCEGHWSVRRK